MKEKLLEYFFVDIGYVISHYKWYEGSQILCTVVELLIFKVSHCYYVFRFKDAYCNQESLSMLKLITVILTTTSTNSAVMIFV